MFSRVHAERMSVKMGNQGKRDWSSDEQVQKMIKRYPVSYHTTFWEVLHRMIGSKSRDVVADFGCGPGLLLVDLAKKFHAKKFRLNLVQC